MVSPLKRMGIEIQYIEMIAYITTIKGLFLSLGPQ